MSEKGWREFLAAEGLDDWVVLHGGATAVFRVESVREAARLAEAIAALPALDGSGALLTIADGWLTVRLSRDLWQLESRHVELARAVSAIARANGAVADRAAVQEVQLAIAAKADAVDVGFWRAVLGYGRRRTTPRPIRWGTDRPSGCRSSPRKSRSDTRCTSTFRSLASRPRPDSLRRWPPAVEWWTNRRNTGRSPTAPGIASTSPRGRTGRCGRALTILPSRIGPGGQLV